MLNLDVRVLLDRYAVSAGDTLTGTIILSPPRASPSSTTLTSLTLTAKCEVKAAFEDHSSTRCSSISHPYLIEKTLITAPTSISSPETAIRFALTLPSTSQAPTTSSWSSSPRFAHCGSHPIPASFGDSIHHTLTVSASTSSRLFSVSKREIYYQFLPTRSIHSPTPNPKSERQPIRSQPARGWRRTLESLALANPSHNPGFPATASLQATMPTTLVMGRPLSVRLDPSYGENHRQGAPLLLRSYKLSLLARHHVRAKPGARRSSVSKTGAVEAETEHTQTERIELAACELMDAAKPLDEGVGVELQDLMETNVLEAAEVVPGFKTWNAALRYGLELEVVVAVGGRTNVLLFKRNVEVLAGVYRAIGEEGAGSETEEQLLWARPGAGSESDEAPPAYSDPPPEYVSVGMSGTTELPTTALIAV